MVVVKKIQIGVMNRPIIGLLIALIALPHHRKGKRRLSQSLCMRKQPLLGPVVAAGGGTSGGPSTGRALNPPDRRRLHHAGAHRSS